MGIGVSKTITLRALNYPGNYGIHVLTNKRTSNLKYSFYVNVFSLY